MDLENQGESQEVSAPQMLLGEYLKQRRLEKNLPLDKLSQKTKISINILKLLEANDFEHLPSAAYIKGFVISYVKVLGLPVQEAIANMEFTYEKILGKPFPALNHTKSMPANQPQVAPAPKDAQGEATPEPSPHEMIEKSDAILQNTKSLLPMTILGIVIALFIGGYKLVSTIVENEVEAQKSDKMGPKIETSAALVNPTDLKRQEPEAPAQEGAKNPSDSNPEVAKTEPKPAPEFERNFPTIEFKPLKGKLFNIKMDAPENADTNLLPENIKSAFNSSMQNVYIRATEGNTWVSYKIDEKPITSVIINKGKDLLLQGSEIRLFLGNVNVTKIFYNNYLIETPNKSGVKSLVFPEENGPKYFMPLFPKAKDDVLYTSEEYKKRMELEENELKKRKENQN